MKPLIILFVALVCLTMFYCSEESPESPPQNSTGKLVIKSNPSGARIYLLGTDTGKNTPDSIDNLEPGDYDGFLCLQYYDTAHFTANILKNLTTTKEIVLEDGLPFINFVWDYSIGYGGDSVRFSFLVNQDILMDSIIVERPIDVSGTYTKDRYIYNKELLVWKDQFGNPVKYFLPNYNLYYPRINNFNYWFNVYGQKAYGAQTYFHIFYYRMFN